MGAACLAAFLALGGCSSEPSSSTASAPSSKAAETATDINGTWAGPVDEFTEDSIPVAAVTRSVGWAPFSEGLPEDRKAPSREDQLKQREGFLKHFRELANNGANIFAPGALGPVRINPVITDAGRQALKAAQDAAITNKIDPKDENSLLRCYPQNRIGIGSPVTIVQGPKAIVFYTTSSARIVYMDGRNIDAAPLSDYAGYSVGHWDGATLVVQTKYFRGPMIGGGFADAFPIREESLVTEYISKTEGGKTLQVKTVLEDPVLFKEKLGKMDYLSPAPDTTVVNENCIEGLASQIHYDTSKFKPR